MSEILPPTESPARQPFGLPPSALAAVAGPALLVLAGLVLLGVLDWRYGLAGAAVVVAGAALLLHGHFARLEALRRYIEELGHGVPGETPRPPRAGSPILSPGLELAIAEAAAERRQRRRDLEAVIAGNEAILVTLPDPLITLSRQRKIVGANPAAIELFGAALAGRDLTEVLRAPAVLDATEAVLGGEAQRFLEFSVPGAVLRTYHARAVRLPQVTPDGAVAILSLHDLTSVKRAEQLRVDFVANASHELRTPLASLLGFIETLRGPARDDEEARHRFLTIMHEQAERMAHLVEDLLSLSRIEMREHSAPTGVADLERVLQSVVGSLEPTAAEKQMTIVVEAAGAPPVVGDRDELAQVFQNLIDNAIKYGKAGTEIRVTARQDAAAKRRLGRPALAVAVRDRGEGIEREHLHRLTERFYRVDTARSRQLGGTGLGLAIVKHIVNRHRGALEVDSERGAGSTFTVVLPLAQSDRKGAEAAAE